MHANQQPNRSKSHTAGLAAAAVAADAAQVVEYIDIGPQGWVQTLPVFLALLQDGTPEGKRQAREQLRRMARIADLGVLAVQRLEQLNDGAFIASQLASAGLVRNAAANDPRQTELDLPQPPTAVASVAPAQQAEAASAGPRALLASRALGRPVPLEVCYSARGFYLGTYVEHEPYSRESVEYWGTRQAAEAALARGQWTQRQEP